jgi:hypothetical protein
LAASINSKAFADRLAGRRMPCFVSSSSGKKPDSDLQKQTAAAVVAAAVEAHEQRWQPLTSAELRLIG